MATCLICGYNRLEDEIDAGVICPCCGNEYDLDDDLSKEDILLIYCGNDETLLYSIAPETKKLKLRDYVEPETAWKFLGLGWLKKGCPFWWKAEKKDFSKEDAYRQVSNVTDKTMEELMQIVNQITYSEIDEDGNLIQY